MQVRLSYAPEAAQVPGVAVTPTDRGGRTDTLNAERGLDFSKAFAISVQLQEPIGGTLQEAAPTQEGLVRFTVCSRAVYRIRVTGPDIEEVTTDALRADRGDRLVNIVLHPKVSKEQRKALKASISASRLRVPKKAQKALDKGNAALKKGKLDVAKAQFEKALHIYPQFDEAQNNLGIVYINQGQRELARAAFLRSIHANDRYAPALVNLAKLAFDDKQYSDASRYSKQALVSEPLSPAALFLAAESAFFKQEFGETIRYGKTLHTLPHSQYALVHFLVAKGLQSQGDMRGAALEYQTFLDEDPDDPNASRARELLALVRGVLAAPSQQGPDK